MFCIKSKGTWTVSHSRVCLRIMKYIFPPREIAQQGWDGLDSIGTFTRNYRVSHILLTRPVFIILRQVKRDPPWSGFVGCTPLESRWVMTRCNMRNVQAHASHFFLLYKFINHSNRQYERQRKKKDKNLTLQSNFPEVILVQGGQSWK